MITDNLQNQIVKAMKARDSVRMETLKMLSAALINAEIEKMREKLTKEEEIKVVQKEAKKRIDAIEAYKKGGADEKAKKEEEELAILQEYLPEEMSDDELSKIVKDSIEQILRQGSGQAVEIGKVMGVVMGKVKGRAGGNRVLELVKKKLSS